MGNLSLSAIRACTGQEHSSKSASASYCPLLAVRVDLCRTSEAKRLHHRVPQAKPHGATTLARFHNVDISLEIERLEGR
jgi:hypothetical protein